MRWAAILATAIVASIGGPPRAMAETRSAGQTAAFISEVERSVPGWLDRYLTPDTDIAVIEDDEVVWTKSFGEAPGDVFEVASLTKTATALGILSLVEDGKLDLDRPVNDYLERWKVKSSAFDESRVTTRRLLDHTAGLPVGFPMDRPSEYPDIVDVLDGKTTMAAATLEKEPGKAFTYSNPGYGVLELLIEEVTGTSYPKAMRKLVFDPLGMDDSGFQDEQELVQRRVPGFRNAKEPRALLVRFPRAAGGMLSTARDIGRLLVGVSRPKDEGGLLEAGSLDEMRRLEDASKGAFGLTGGGYALGVAQQLLPSGDLFVANNGTHESYNALMLAVPDRRVGVVVLTNSGTGLGVEAEVAISFFDRVVGERPALAGRFTTFRNAVRIATIVALLLCLLFLARVVVGVRRGRRAWPGELRIQPLLLKSIPLGALGAALYLVVNTALITSSVGGVPPSRFISGDHHRLMTSLALGLVASGVAATWVPRRKAS